MARQGLTQHRKFARLVRRIESIHSGMGIPLARGMLELLWEPAYDAGDDALGDIEDIEARCHWRGPDGFLVQALLEAGGADQAGFIEVDPERPGKFRIHDLFDHAPASVCNRYKREMARKARGVTMHELKVAAGKARWKAGGEQAGADDRHVLRDTEQVKAGGEQALRDPEQIAPLTTHYTPHTSHDSEKKHADKPRAPELPGITSQDGQESAAAAGGEPEAQAKRVRALAGDLAALRDVLEALAPDRVQLEDICKPAVAIRKLHLTQDKVPIPAVAILGAWIAAGGDEWCLKAGAVLTWSVLASHGDHLIAVAKAWDKQGRPAMRKANGWQEHEPERVMHPSSVSELKRRFTPHDCKPGEACDLCGRGAMV